MSKTHKYTYWIGVTHEGIPIAMRVQFAWKVGLTVVNRCYWKHDNKKENGSYIIGHNRNGLKQICSDEYDQAFAL